MAASVPSRTNPRQSAATKYVTAFRQRTSCEPKKAIPIPLNAGPKMMPRLVCTLDESIRGRELRALDNQRHDDVSAGLNIDTATASRRDKGIQRLTVKLSVWMAQG